MSLPNTMPWRRKLVLGILIVLNVGTALVTLPTIFLYSAQAETDSVNLGVKHPGSVVGAGTADDERLSPTQVELWRELERESVQDPVVLNLLTQGNRAGSPKPHSVPWQRLSVVIDASQVKPSWGFSKRVKNSLDEKVLISPRIHCDSDTMLFVGVCSAMHHFDLRNAIRKTWGSFALKKNLGIRILFFIGDSVNSFNHFQPKIIEESELHGDIVQLDLVDSYKNLTLKTLSVLSWSKNNCASAKFIMKSDDDVFVNISNLIKILEENIQMFRQRFILGYIIRDASPIKDRYSKWFTPNSVFKNKTYPTYASGSAYVISRDLVSDILSGAEKTSIFWLEDVFVTGILARQCGARMVHNDGFTYRRGRRGPCHFLQSIAAHQITAEEMLKIWTDIHTRNIGCVVR